MLKYKTITSKALQRTTIKIIFVQQIIHTNDRTQK